jgi:hypothetical protein
MTKDVPRAEQWAGQICAQLSKSAEAIIATGRLLVKAKADLPYGEWGRMFEDKLVPFGIDSAQKLMKISEHRQLSNTAHVRYLPSSYATLYELTKVPDKTLNNAFRDGLIMPSMERREVRALLPARAESSRASVAHKPCSDPEFTQALDEARQWMARWGHLSALAPVCDAITAVLEQARS